ncbi:Uncharacterized protein dnl_20610 [Desulfonema limicola]|uniref:Uncharacterized protein n=1 Tax=Desulfonema limicola TaxID=45656 RepID=A0A975GFY4_9BACT|nr:hypothetical protein [Desulfonema limicola]QTA79781.1 Uncharacterized protein dnl_20610 [Desulfonema limicola]
MASFRSTAPSRLRSPGFGRIPPPLITADIIDGREKCYRGDLLGCCASVREDVIAVQVFIAFGMPGVRQGPCKSVKG